MTYSPETQAIIAAVTAGDTCPDCGAPNHLRHFDECPRHPENVKASKPMVYVQTRGYCEPCLYFSSCPEHDPDGSVWQSNHKGELYFDASGIERVAGYPDSYRSPFTGEMHDSEGQFIQT